MEKKSFRTWSLFPRNQCLFCGRTISVANISPATQAPVCGNPKCGSHRFIMGNRVIHRTRPELGVGIIRRVVLSKPSKNQIIFTKKKRRGKQLKLFEEDEDTGKKHYEKFQIDFSSYVEYTLFAQEITHYIWPDGTRIRFIAEKTEKEEKSGFINKINCVHPNGLVHYEIAAGDAKLYEISEMDVLDEIQSPLEEYFKNNLVSTEQFVLRMWSAQMQDLYRSNQLKIITNSRLSLLPHQLSVAHHLLEIGNARYILADEVGLGKTIEAGIFVKEMLARNLAKRILIITPASIIGQWEFEMANKFNLDFTRLTSKVLKNSEINYMTGNFQDVRSGENFTLCTATIQYARLNSCSRHLEKIEWDIVIFDEAHHLRRYLTNQKTGQYRTTLAYELAMKLSGKTKSLLLLTATPIQLHAFDLYSLVQLLNPFVYPTFDSFEIARKGLPLLNRLVQNLQNFTRINSYERTALVDQVLQFLPNISQGELGEKLRFNPYRTKIIQKLAPKHFLSQFIIRNRRRIVFPDNKVQRLPKIVEVDMTDGEKRVYQKIHLYLARIYSQSFIEGQSGLGFVMVILQKLLTSSVPAILGSLKRRIIYLEENKEMILKLGTETETFREFTEDVSSQDLAWGLDELDLEDREVVQKRKRKTVPKKKKSLNIDDHIKILKEFVVDLHALTIDSKAANLLAIVQAIMDNDPDSKLIIFTQFKATLFYLRRLLNERGWKVNEFHGSLSEAKKNDSVLEFRREGTILLSTEIGGEGRNFQFCNIIVNYDLPWNPMRLEQRIGRIDRIGQTKNIYIYNFYIKDTVESLIINAITDRIHLFEESIGALEPILGKMEGQIKDLVLKQDADTPLKFRMDEVISKTSQDIKTVYDKLDDFILDKRSFQYDQLVNGLDRPDQITGVDVLPFFEVARHNFTNEFTITPDSQPDVAGIWALNFSEKLRGSLQLPRLDYYGVFDIALARKHEEFDFFALGHPVLMAFLDYFQGDNSGGVAAQLQIEGKKWIQILSATDGVQIPLEEMATFQRVLDANQQLNLFLFEIEYLGIIIEKTVVPILITDEGENLPTFANFISLPHNLKKILQLSDDLPAKDHPIAHDETVTRDILEERLATGKQLIKQMIGVRAQELIQLNRNKYLEKRARILRNLKSKRQYAKVQLLNTESGLRAKKLKLPTQRQRDNAAKIEIPAKKKRRLKEFEKIEREIQYLEVELQRWADFLEGLEFDEPEQLKRIQKYKQLSINANFLGFARIFLN